VEFQSVDDYLVETAPEEDLERALAALHEQIVAGNIPLIGYPRTWDRAGRQIKSSTRPELISTLMPALKFVLLPNNDLAVIGHDQHFDGRPIADHLDGGASRYGGPITWVKDDYDESAIAFHHETANPIEGWGELLIDADEAGSQLRRAFKSWLRKAYPDPQIHPGIKKLAQQFTVETGIIISADTIRRALGLKR
jgi:hypothetical protein